MGRVCAGAYHRYVLSGAYILECLTVYYLLSILYKNLACYRKPTKSVISSDKNWPKSPEGASESQIQMPYIDSPCPKKTYILFDHNDGFEYF